MDMPVEVKADVSESANNLIAKPSKSIGSVISSVIDFFHNTLLLPMQRYNIRAEHNLKQYQEELENKISQIPEEKKSEPNMNIWGQTMESLKWNMDDEQKYIRDMFMNILTADVNSDTKSKVQPAFIEIVKQLSKDDAEFLSHVIGEYMNLNIYEERIYTREVNSPKPQEHFMVRRYLGTIEPKKGDSLYNADFEKSLDNLKRLGIVSELPGYWGKWQQAKRFEKDGAWKKTEDNKNLEIATDITQNNRLEVTAFGKQFIQICLK